MKFIILMIVLTLAIVSTFAQGQSDNLSAVIIGSGSPQYSAERAGPSVLIRYKDQNILVDMGNGSAANLNKINFRYNQLTGIFITHHHLDHNEEFIPTFIQTILGGNKFQIAGPTPTKEYVTSVLSIYEKDIAYRLGRRGGRDFSSVKDNFTVRELNGGETFNVGDIKVTTTKVNHTIETVAYRFDAGGKSIVISGDLTYSESLSELAKNADVLIIDSGAVVRNGGANNRPNGQGNGNAQNQNGQNRRPQGQMGQGQGGQGGRPQGQGQQGGERAHSTLEEIGKMAKDANVKKLIMNHLPSAEVNEEATKTRVANSFKGEIIFAKDLMQIQTSN